MVAHSWEGHLPSLRRTPSIIVENAVNQLLVESPICSCAASSTFAYSPRAYARTRTCTLPQDMQENVITADDIYIALQRAGTVDISTSDVFLKTLAHVQHLCRCFCFIDFKAFRSVVP